MLSVNFGSNRFVNLSRFEGRVQENRRRNFGFDQIHGLTLRAPSVKLLDIVAHPAPRQVSVVQLLEGSVHSMVPYEIVMY